MTLVQILVALVVLGIVAMVVVTAAGRGGELPDAPPTRPDLGLPPPDDPVEVEDLEALRFGVVFRGYRPDEVESVLDRLAGELRRRDERIAALEGRVVAPSTTAGGEPQDRSA